MSIMLPWIAFILFAGTIILAVWICRKLFQ